ncbi:MAG: dethiobiotin synthase [Candidatus Margulisbacteria bacterium]|nr:dethiobiotin synthase [Candidatus Margulisiibacteriota bacterium]
MNIFVTGTDTGAGKTVVCAALLSKLKNENPFYYKPIQTGAVYQNNSYISEDVETINKLTASNFSSETSCTYLLKEAVSPLQAAEKENLQIDINKIINQFHNLQKKHSTIIIEGAGGVYVPITSKLYMFDLICALNCPAIVVIKPGLGTINHTLMTFEVLKKCNIKILGFIVSDYPEETDLVTKENPVIIEKLSGIKCLGKVFHYVDIAQLSKNLSAGLNYFSDFYPGFP